MLYLEKRRENKVNKGKYLVEYTYRACIKKKKGGNNAELKDFYNKRGTVDQMKRKIMDRSKGRKSETSVKIM